MRVAFAGAPDTGKTTLAKMVSSEFNLRGYKVTYIDEFARDYISRFGFAETAAEQYFIVRKQKEKEPPFLGVDEILFTDSPDFLSYIYCLDVADLESPKDRTILFEILSMVLPSRYNMVFLTKKFRETFDDGVRSRFIESIDAIDEAIESFLKLHRIPYIILDSKDLNVRKQQVIDNIEMKIGHKVPLHKDVK